MTWVSPPRRSHQLRVGKHPIPFLRFGVPSACVHARGRWPARPRDSRSPPALDRRPAVQHARSDVAQSARTCRRRQETHTDIANTTFGDSALAGVSSGGSALTASAIPAAARSADWPAPATEWAAPAQAATACTVSAAQPGPGCWPRTPQAVPRSRYRARPPSAAAASSPSPPGRRRRPRPGGADLGQPVLATLQQDRAGVWVQSVVPKVSTHSFTVHLSKAVSSRTTVAWFVVN